MSRKALFPGSFDPVHLGHVYVVKQALNLFDEIIVAIGTNSNKKAMFSMEDRISWLEASFASESGVSIATYEGLTVDFCRQVDAQFILRGLRNATDFQYEKGIAQMNHALYPDIETVFLLTAPELSAINSTIVRDIAKHDGDTSKFVPPGVKIH